MNLMVTNTKLTRLKTLFITLRDSGIIGSSPEVRSSMLSSTMMKENNFSTASKTLMMMGLAKLELPNLKIP